MFTSNQAVPAPGDWVGVHMLGTSPSAVSHAIVEYAGAWSGTGAQGALRAENGSHLIDNSILRKNDRYGLVLSFANNTVVRNSIFTEHDPVSIGAVVDIEGGGPGATSFLSNTLVNNTCSRILIVTAYGTGVHRIHGNHFENNVAWSGEHLCRR